MKALYEFNGYTIDLNKIESIKKKKHPVRISSTFIQSIDLILNPLIMIKMPPREKTELVKAWKET